MGMKEIEVSEPEVSLLRLQPGDIVLVKCADALMLRDVASSVKAALVLAGHQETRVIATAGSDISTITEADANKLLLELASKQ
jgi:hypothetical protein